jgi:hypothetical protein
VGNAQPRPASAQASTWTVPTVKTYLPIIRKGS